MDQAEIHVIGRHRIVLNFRDDVGPASAYSLLLAENIPDLTGKTAVDLGTGSGILAIVASLQGATTVYLLDTYDKAISLALENGKRNGVEDRLIRFGFRALFEGRDQEQQLVDITETIRAVLEPLRNELKEHQIELRSELMSELPPVYGNASQLQEVVSNLIVNAIEAMETSANRDRVLDVRTELCDGKAIRVAIEDSGPGIDKDKLDGIFTAFVTTKRRGRGLGLSISRMIVEYHGGKLTASSDQKGGASFQFVLPIAS
jgi:signal transduction histidine kinase